MKSSDLKIVPINWVDKTERSALIPGHEGSRKIRRLKELKKVKGNCYFTHGISKDLIDFIYRAVTKLDLKDKKLLFSRGAVKKKGRSVLNAVGICELNWDTGISIRIPQKLNYSRTIRILVDNKEYSPSLMEIIVLTGLLHLARPGKNSDWCSNMAASIIVNGWEQINSNPSEIYLL